MNPSLLTTVGAVVIPSDYFQIPIHSSTMVDDYMIVQLGDSYAVLKAVASTM